MMTKPVVLFGCLLFFLTGLAAQTGFTQVPSASGPSASGNVPAPASGNGSAQVPDISLYTLFRAAEGADTVWRPDWPPELPPDLFYAGSAASITVDMGDGKQLVYSRNSDGKVLSFPILMAEGSDTNGKGSVFFQGRCEYNQGRLSKLTWEEPGGSSGTEGTDAEILQWDADGRPLLCRVFSGDYFFIALEYRSDSMIETWYNRDGKALYIAIAESAGQTRIFAGTAEPAGQTSAPADPAAKQVSSHQETRFYYNSDGLISKIEYAVGANDDNGGEAGKSMTALYNQQGMPLYLEQVLAEERAVYWWQWDKAERLVRFSGNPAIQGPEVIPVLDYRYEYTLDVRGNWTERRGFSMVPVDPDRTYLVPDQVQVIRRVIRYEETG